jgi:hypothetical protein
MKSRCSNPLIPLLVGTRLPLARYYCMLVLAVRDWLITRSILQCYNAMKKDGLINDLDYNTLSRRSYREGFQFLTVTLPVLGKSFDSALGSGLLHLPSNFGRYKGRGIPKFMVQHFRRVFSDDGTLLQSPDVDSIRSIRQVCFYAYKAKLPVGAAKERMVLDSFLETEGEVLAFVSQRDSPFRICSTSPIVDRAADLISRVFANFNSEKLLRFRPKHGKGVTADLPIKRKWSSKPKSLGYSWIDPLNVSFEDLFYFSSEHKCDMQIPQPAYDPYAGWLRPVKGQTAKVILVPKDSRGPRIISAEPVHRQFIQQGLMAYMVTTLETHPLTKGQVNFADQGINRSLALSGSKSLYWSTLDLKEASDRVSLAMVEAYFRKCPELLRCLTASRSTHTRLPDGRVIQLAKFAPMGSACCFPVLATCIWFTIVAAIELFDLPCDPSEVFVYGDDVIVPTKIANFVGPILAHVGLKVNKAKSFINSRFLESCGMDAFEGQNVTPTRLRHINLLDLTKATEASLFAVSCVEHGNLSNKAGHHYLAFHAFGVGAKLLGKLPRVPDKSGIIGISSSNPLDWDSHLGRPLKGWAITPDDYLFPCNPWDHYRRLFAGNGSGMVKFGSGTLPRRVRLRRVTIPSHLVSNSDHPTWVEKLFPQL